ncbi:MAG: hypothetical protein WBO16_15710 [Gammaproteobacteria bacterium]|jgi:hypothetical protein
MGISLNNAGHTAYAGPYAKTLCKLEKRIQGSFTNWKKQQEAWQKFHQTAAGKHVPRRVWMRHGALLEVLSRKCS